MPAASHVIETLIAELLDFVSPSEKDWLVSVTASLIVGGCDSEQGGVGYFASKRANLLECWVRFLNRRNEQSLSFPLQDPHNEVDLLHPHLPIASEPLLDSADPLPSLDDILFDLPAHPQGLEEVEHEFLGRDASQMHSAAKRDHRVLNVATQALLGCRSVSFQLERRSDLHFEYDPENRGQVARLLLLFVHGLLEIDASELYFGCLVPLADEFVIRSSLV